MPTISVLMSVYNEPIDWIKQSIDSILMQTFSDFEFIIINDKPDRFELAEFLEEESRKDSRIKVHTNSENIGLPASLNKGISISKGRYIARMDADDISLTNRLKEQIIFMETNPAIGICGTYVRTIDENGNIAKRFWQMHTPESLRDAIISYCPFVHPTVIARREIFEKYRYDENCRVAQDWNLWLRVVEDVNFANIPEILLYYRIHHNQSQIKAGAERSRKSRFYSDCIFADKLALQGEIRQLFIKSRSDEQMSLQELDRLYDYLLKESFVGKSREFAMCKFISTLRNNGGIRFLLTSKTIKKNPGLFVSAILLLFRTATAIRRFSN